MANRFVSRIGNIFCMEIDNEYKCYFQYIANDRTQLNSSVIRVFKKRYSLKDNPSMDEIIKDDVLFYAHTVIKIGYLENTWYKVGTHRDVGNISSICFKDRCFAPYYIWNINGPFVRVDAPTEEDKKYGLGSVFPHFCIVNKIKYNRFWGEEGLY